MRRSLVSAILTLAWFAVTPADANQQLRWAAKSDILSLDPHASGEGLTSAILGNIYERLINRNPDMAFVPGLATSWQRLSENLWEFQLRKGVRFHNGEAFDADDVIFSLNRARVEGTDFHANLANVDRVEKTSSHVVQIHTKTPHPTLPTELTTILITDSGWAAENMAEIPSIEAARNLATTNGTGPFRVVRWLPGTELNLTRHDNWWGDSSHSGAIVNASFFPIPDDNERISELLAGRINLVTDPPPAMRAMIEFSGEVRTQMVPEIRTIFLGFNIRGQSQNDDQKENPLSDLRVRKAIRLSLDTERLRTTVMNGLSYPAGMIVAPGVLGHDFALDQPIATDLAQARALLTEAGYPDGFSIRLDCPNNRYVKDEEICNWVAEQLQAVNIDVAVNAAPRKEHFARIKKRETDFYLLGWAAPGLDSAYIYQHLVQSGATWNATGYADSALETLIAEVSSEGRILQRTILLQNVWAAVDEALPYLPLHHQVILWAKARRLYAPITPDNNIRLHLFHWSR